MHHFNDKFRSVTDIRVNLLEEFGDDLPGTINFDVGFYEKRSSKCLLVSCNDVMKMYEAFKKDEDILLWCDAGKDESDKSRKRKRDSNEDEVDLIFQELKDIHANDFSIPQYRLWARMIYCGTHDSQEDPPAVPMFIGSQPKRSKKSTLVDTIAEGVAAISKAVTGNSSKLNTTSEISSSSAHWISPGKSCDLRMKNLQQLRYIQQLFEDNILSEAEFLDQKKSILDSLKKMNQ